MKEKARYIVLTDINQSFWNPYAEIDDIQSLIRLLLYSNDIDLEGIIPCTSCFLKRPNQKKQLRIIHRIIDEYAAVKPNLDVHANGYPDSDFIHKLVFSGISTYGEGPGRGFAHEKYSDNPGVQRIIRVVDAPDPRPVWIGLWGGAGTLAQAIWQVANTRTESELELFLDKLRIYSISDQDMAGPWIRSHYGDRLKYLVTPSPGTVRGSKAYFKAVWPGISGDHFEHGSENGSEAGGFTGANWDMISGKWISQNITSVGSYGKQYPKTVYLTEGDTPSFLGLIPNGLNEPEHPEYGGWGGRHVLTQYEGEKHPIYTGAPDEVLGVDGKFRISPQASLWRWREDFQNDFSARMQWTVSNKYSQCVHVPRISTGISDKLHVTPGERITLDASGSVSPDNLPVLFQWSVYKEAGQYFGDVAIEGNDRAKATVSIPADINAGSEIHIILKVMLKHHCPLSAYHRIILSV